MARDGSGNYARPVADYVFNTTIDETKVNQEFDQVATALTDSIAKDGQTNPTANLPMAGYKHTGVAVASARDEYADVAAVQDGDYVFGGDAGGTATALTCSLSPAITAYADGMRIWLITGSAATGAATLNVNGIGAKSIVDISGNAIAAGAWQSGFPICLVYEAGNDEFRVVAPTSYMSLSSTSVVFNEDGADKDFRIEGDTDVNLFFVDAGTETACFGLADPGTFGSSKVKIENTSSGATTVALDLINDASAVNTAVAIDFTPNSNIKLARITAYRTNDGGSGATDLRFGTYNGSAFGDRFTVDSSGNLGAATTTPDASALLDLVSTTQGFLPPRGTSTQRDNISTPAEHLIFGNTTDKTLDHYNGTSWKPLVRGWTNSGAIDLTSGSPTSVSLLSGASNVNEIEIHIDGASTNTANQAPMLQIGDSGGYETTGYSGYGQTHARNTSANNSISSNSTGFLLAEETLHDAGDTSDHVIRLIHLGSNVWSLSSNGQIPDGVPTTTMGTGLKTLSAALDRVQITTSGGAATFDGGTAYLRWR